jgi:hypothetical protein
MKATNATTLAPGAASHQPMTMIEKYERSVRRREEKRREKEEKRKKEETRHDCVKGVGGIQPSGGKHPTHPSLIKSFTKTTSKGYLNPPISKTPTQKCR